jgi:hypothetical protein
MKEPVHKLQSWLDQHLIFNLEKSFRCLRPYRLFPVWLKDAGFEIQDKTKTEAQESIRLPCLLDEESCTIEDRIACEIGRRLWEDVWGSYVDLGDGDAKFWWEDENITNGIKSVDIGIRLHLILARKP